MKHSKYKNVKTAVDSITFSSKKEANYYGVLKMRKLAGEIDDFECQAPFRIEVNDQLICKYIADFVTYNDDEIFEVIDTKGVRTPMFILKKRLMSVVLGITIIEK